MATKTEKQNQVQKAFRCSEEMNISLNRLRGAWLMKNGLKISENSFLVMLLELGLAELEEKEGKVTAYRV